MGIAGLMTFMCNNSCMKTHKLSDCFLVIDGLNISCRLAAELKSDTAFGGDYDEYFSLVKNFLLRLQKCNICPIVLFDGPCKETKLEKKLRRKRKELIDLEAFCYGFSRDRFLPLLLMEVFLNAVRDMGFMCVQCDFEADTEIASVARKLNCPVLSNDSDYFIYDAMFIPYRTIKLIPVKDPYTSKYYMKCSIYNVDDFLSAVSLDKPLLYVFAMLLENDHIENDVFLRFFDLTDIPYNIKKFIPEKFNRLILWLQKENENSALNYICSCLGQKDAEKVRELFNRTKTIYSSPFISKSVSDELLDRFGARGFFSPPVQSLKSVFGVNLPSEIATLYSQNIIPNFVVKMILYQWYLTYLQVEDLYDQSSHFRFLSLIRIIYTMLTPYLKTKRPLQVYLVLNKEYRIVEVDADPSSRVYLHEVLKQSWEERLKLLCDITRVPMNDLKFVPCNSWALFMLGFTCWVKEFKNSLSQAHIHAFVIMIIANKIVQSKVGYYGYIQEFEKDHDEDEIKELRRMKIPLERSSDFKEMLSSVEQQECLYVQKALMPFRRTTKFAIQEYNIRTVHLYNCFQTSLFYIMSINALLNLPLPHVRVEEFYSGTLLYNLYLNIISKSNVEEFGSTLFLQAPNLNEIYKYLSVKLSKILEKAKKESTN